MELKLNKPIVFFDLETTGANVATDRVVEISMLKIHPDGREEIITQRVNPTIPIHPQATAVHGITNEDVKDCPTFAKQAQLYYNFIKDCDLGGYNSNKFDVPVLVEEFLRAGVDIDMKNTKLLDVLVVFYKMEPRTLSAAYKFYCNKIMENAHSAEYDIKATYEILKAQLDRYTDLQNDVPFLSEFTTQNNNVDFSGQIVYDDKSVEVFNFGKHKNKPVEDVFKQEPAYYSWMMNSDFPLYTKKIITQIKLRIMKK